MSSSAKIVKPAIIIAIVVVVAAAVYFLMNKTPQEARESNQAPTEEMAAEAPSDLQINDVKVGEGEEAKSGDKVKVHYVGTLMDGTKFDSSRDRGEPFEFDIGKGMVIKGWDEGVAGMKVGGIRELVIPPSMGYGDQAVGPIPAGSTLKFEVELIEVVK